ncbi:MAG: redoxin domain-containing protein [Sedimentisphaerales bacterium]|nr:redoxin domain-containing protein [Sedimentisphaerales bacterium]
MDQNMMDVWQTVSPTPTPPKNPIGEVRIALAVAAFVLGAVALALSPAVVGLLWGIAGAIIAITSLTGPYQGKTLAGWGLGLSLAGILVSCFFGLIWYAGYQEAMKDSYTEWDEDEISAMDDDANPWEKWIGEKVNDFTLTDSDGGTFTLSEHRGRWTLVHFWSPSDPISRDAAEHLIALREEIPPEQMTLIAVSRWHKSDVTTGVARRLKLNYPVYSVLEDYDAEEENCPLPDMLNEFYEIPGTIYINPQGRIRYILTTYHESGNLRFGLRDLANGTSDTTDPNSLL